MLITPQKDGSVLVEVRGQEFSEAWRTANDAAKVVLQDRRPAVRRISANGTQYITLHRMAWATLKGNMANLPVGQARIRNRVKLCDWCGAELKIIKELTNCWSFQCPKCNSVEVHDKLIIGGTQGQGEKEKT